MKPGARAAESQIEMITGKRQANERTFQGSSLDQNTRTYGVERSAHAFPCRAKRKNAAARGSFVTSAADVALDTGVMASGADAVAFAFGAEADFDLRASESVAVADELRFDSAWETRGFRAASSGLTATVVHGPSSCQSPATPGVHQ